MHHYYPMFQWMLLHINFSISLDETIHAHGSLKEIYTLIRGIFAAFAVSVTKRTAESSCLLASTGVGHAISFAVTFDNILASNRRYKTLRLSFREL